MFKYIIVLVRIIYSICDIMCIVFIKIIQDKTWRIDSIQDVDGPQIATSFPFEKIEFLPSKIRKKIREYVFTKNAKVSFLSNYFEQEDEIFMNKIL